MSPAQKLKQMLEGPEIVVAPGVYDAMTTKLVERAGFGCAFMGGFAATASRLCLPDTGLMSYAEMVDQGRNCAEAVSIPVVGDGDTGFGNAINVKRTVRGYANAGLACVMIEDQVSPKRCGHTKGKRIVPEGEAFKRIEAAVDAREEGADILILARTDANYTDGMDEAIRRCQTFREIGADMTFLEAPRDADEMRRYCGEVDGPKMANMVEQGETPFLSPAELQEIGYQFAIWPVSMMLAGIQAMERTLTDLAAGKTGTDGKATFGHLQEIVGFPGYYDAEKRYAAE